MPGQFNKRGHVFVMKRTSKYEGIEKTCEGCGCTFSFKYDRNVSSFQFMKRKFCSAECRVESHNSKIISGFWDMLDKSSRSGCWEWTSTKTTKGYGKFSFKNKSVRAHRHAYEIAKGPIPEGMFVLHSCDNRLCCNPDHLRIGTALDNFEDAMSRGRMPHIRRAA